MSQNVPPIPMLATHIPMLSNVFEKVVTSWHPSPLLELSSHFPLGVHVSPVLVLRLPLNAAVGVAFSRGGEAHASMESWLDIGSESRESK